MQNPYAKGTAYIRTRILKLFLYPNRGITYPNIYNGPILLQKASKYSPSFCVSCSFSSISATIFAPIGKPHKKPMKMTYNIEEGRGKKMPRMGRRHCPIFKEIPVRIIKPDKTMKGKREGIILWYQMSKPLEASKIHSLEKNRSKKSKIQQKRVKKLCWIC